jgi:hypothetical protein
MWRTEKTQTGTDFVWDGAENGIASSPFIGTANIQNANISTEIGDVLASFSRTAQQQAALSNQTLTPDGATLFNAPTSLKGGQWIKVTASTVSSITAATNPTTLSIDYLIVGGGGGGGAGRTEGAGGGGGAGEYVSSTTTLAVGGYTVAVGDGGAASAGLNAGSSGGSSSIETIDTAVGGGGGGLGITNISPTTPLNGVNGGSGGGGGAGDTSYQGTGGAGSAGNNGGAGFASGTIGNRAGGGGGGSAGAGTAGTSAQGGAGGAGTSNSITGTAVFYAAGGGGGSVGTPGQGGSSDAGGDGGEASAGANATTPGSGGGGGSSLDTTTWGGGTGADGIVVISYTIGAAFCTGGDVVYNKGGKTIHVFNTDGEFKVHSINTGGLYFVSYADGAGKIKLSDFYDPYGATPLTHGTTGSITFSTVAVPNQAIAKAVENYNTDGSTEYRYYILDKNGYVWLWDTQVYETNGFMWMLPDSTDYSTVKIGGIAVLNGWLMAVAKAFILCKPTVNLGGFFTQMADGETMNPFDTHSSFAMTGSQGKMYYVDSQFLGEIFPTTSLLTSEANIQSYCKYSASSTTGTITELINGSVPYLVSSAKRVPVVFFTDTEGTLPTAISNDVVYYIEYNPASQTFEVYNDVDVGQGSIQDIQTGASGNQYFNTFYPVGYAGWSSSTPLLQFQPQRVNLPFYEQATCLVEVGNTILVGCEGSAVYPWNQIDAIVSDVIQLPEANVKTMLNVNNMAYIFAGYKGNIYISNTAVASLALKIPDYCAGVAGTKNSYIEPVFTWGDAMYCRGRVYFSVLDQTSTKSGNCGGVWSFIPSQNVDANALVGNSLRLENQNSYNDYDGYATILLPAIEQTSQAPQYWAAWQDSYNTSTAAFGIDGTGTTPVTSYIIETDILATGSILSKETFSQLEYKLSAPLESGESVQMYYRVNATDAWTSAGTTIDEPTILLSGYYQIRFQKTQWVQFRVVATTNGSTSSSFVRLQQIRLR